MKHTLLLATLISTSLIHAQQAPSIYEHQARYYLVKNLREGKNLIDCTVACSKFYQELRQPNTRRQNGYGGIVETWENAYPRHKGIAQAIYLHYKKTPNPNHADYQTEADDLIYRTALAAELKETIEQIHIKMQQ